MRQTQKSPAKPRESLRLYAVIAAGIIIATAALVIAMSPRAAGPSLIGGPFTLEGGDGKTVTNGDFAGRPFLVYFGYTHCPDICPTTLAQISDVLKKLPDRKLPVLFITVDPERDTAKLMADYVSSFDPRIIGLSGTPDQIAAVEKAYRVYARKAPGKDGDYSMDHSSVIYLMDAKGGFVEAFNLERSPAEAAKELESFL